MLWDDLEGWDGGEGGTEAPEGGGIADSLCCAAETNTTCNTAIPQLKNFFKKKKTTQFAVVGIIGCHWPCDVLFDPLLPSADLISWDRGMNRDVRS